MQSSKPTISSLQIAQAQAQIHELEEQVVVIQDSLGHLKKILGAFKPIPQPPYDPEQGIGSPRPKVVVGRQNRRR